MRFAELSKSAAYPVAICRLSVGDGGTFGPAATNKRDRARAEPPGEWRVLLASRLLPAVPGTANPQSVHTVAGCRCRRTKSGWRAEAGRK